MTERGTSPETGAEPVEIRRIDAAEPWKQSVVALQVACRAADGAEPFNEATMLELGGRSGALALAPDGALLGAALARRTDDGLDAELAVRPDVRRRGLGARLETALADAAEGATILAWAHGRTRGALALAAARGYEPVRTLFRLALPFDAERRERALAEAELPAPEGVDLGPMRLGADEDDLLRVNAEAFRDHPEQGSLDRAGFDERAREAWFDPERVLIARDAGDGRMLGFNWLKVDDDEAEIYVIGVADDAAGRGIGRALMRGGLGLLARTGRPRAVLYVEGDNERALGLYRSLGFEDDAIDLQLRRG